MILDNPFHVLGLIANCGNRARTRREAEVKRFLEVRKPLLFRDDLYFPGCHRNEATVTRAIATLHDASDRIGFGLFWFTHGSIIDDRALRLLVNGDPISALDIWKKIETIPPTRSYASSLNNLGTLCLLIALIRKVPGREDYISDQDVTDYLHRGLAAKACLVGSLSEADLSSYCATFSDEISTSDPSLIVSAFADALEHFKNEAENFGLDLPAGDLGSLLNSGGSRISKINQQFASNHRQALERSIAECRGEYTNRALKAVSAGRKLMDAAQEHLPELATYFSYSDYAYTSLADKVADELLNASVAFFNFHLDTDKVSLRVVHESMSLDRYAVEISCSPSMRARAQDNLDTTLKIKRKLRQGLEMKSVRRSLRNWIDKAQIVLRDESDPEDKIAFVDGAISKHDSSDDDSTGNVCDLLENFRVRGTKIFGRDFYKSDEMIQCGSLACRVLTAIVISACNCSERKTIKQSGAVLLSIISQHFVPVSSDGMTSAVFLVNEEAFNHLDENRAIASSEMSTRRSARFYDFLDDFFSVVFAVWSHIGCIGSIVVVYVLISFLGFLLRGCT